VKNASEPAFEVFSIRQEKNFNLSTSDSGHGYSHCSKVSEQIGFT
jgi:hypothetical protein